MRDPKKNQYAVLGLGRFGLSIVQTLSKYDVSVLACDIDPHRVQEASEYATQALQLNISEEASLDHIGIGNFDVVIVAVGADFEAVLMATTIAKEKGARFVMAKALSDRQKKILHSVGADRVVLPEREMGEKIARGLIGTSTEDVYAESEHYTISEMHPMEYFVGKTVEQSKICAEYKVKLLAIRRGHKTIIPVLPDEVLRANDILLTLQEH